MTLNAEQREGTARELRRNLELSGLTRAAVADALEFDVARLERALDVTEDADPVDVWMLRDHLERAVRAAGGVPQHHSVLTESARDDARRWFGLPIRKP